MKLEVKNYIEFGKTDKSVVYFNLRAENPTEEALLTALYGFKGRVLTCNKFLEVTLSRKVGQ